MKIFPNLAGSLRFYFGLARTLTVIGALFWFFILFLAPLIQRRLTDAPKLMVSFGEASLQSIPNPVRLGSDNAEAGPLELTDVRGSLRMNFLSKDRALSSALRHALYPCILVLVAFSWWLFSSLRNVCANIERGEVFSESNLRLVRNIGFICIGYSVAGLAVQLWAAHVMGDYLVQHVTLTGLKQGLSFSDGLGSVRFRFPSGLFPTQGGFVTGFVVLLMSQAFRQGLALKTENDLTV